MFAGKYFAGQVKGKIALSLKKTCFGHWANLHTFRRATEDPRINLHWSRTTGEILKIRATTTNGAYPPSDYRVGDYKIARLDLNSRTDVHLLGAYSTPVDSEGNLLAYAVLPDSYQHFLLHVDLETLLRSSTRHWPNRPKTISMGFPMVNAWNHSYFHWFVEMLPRSVFLLDWFDPIDDICLVVGQAFRDWQRRSLELLGFSDRQISRNSTGSLFVEKMLIPAHSHQRVDNVGVFVPSMLESMRYRILHSELRMGREGTLSQRIYISRRKARGRRIANEDELSQKLIHFGFGIYCLEDMSLDEQISLFSRAKLIVAPHGAGLTNMLWADNATIVEIFGAYWNPSFLTLANALDHRYLCFQAGRFSENWKGRFQVLQKRQDFTINVDEFLRFLQRYV